LSCYLQNEQLLPIERTQSVLSDIFGFSQVSEGVILDSSWVCYQGLSDWEEQQKKALQGSEVLHVDETGFRVNGKRAWGHVCATDKLTLAISLETHYQAIIAQGLLDNPIPKRINPKGKIKKTASLNLLECFRDHKTEIFRFFHQENAPFDYNLAERDLRMFKLKEKISTSFRTEKGAKIFCRVCSYISTLKKQGKTVWEYLCLFFDNKCIQITYN
jgi:transposase-like protein